MEAYFDITGTKLSLHKMLPPPSVLTKATFDWDDANGIRQWFEDNKVDGAFHSSSLDFPEEEGVSKETVESFYANLQWSDDPVLRQTLTYTPPNHH